jgi:hypothetical protein
MERGTAKKAPHHYAIVRMQINSTIFIIGLLWVMAMRKLTLTPAASPRWGGRLDDYQYPRRGATDSIPAGVDTDQ